MAQAQDTRSLSGRTFVITGASSGFGRIGAEYYARLGAKVFATMRGLPRPEASELIAGSKAAKANPSARPHSPAMKSAGRSACGLEIIRLRRGMMSINGRFMPSLLGSL